MRKIKGIPINEYHAIHYWLKKIYGKANKCELDNCTKISKKFNWSLKKNHKYEFNRDNFQMLCRSCHSKQDITRNTIKKMKKCAIKFWKKNKSFKIQCKKCGKNVTGYTSKKFCKKCAIISDKENIKKWLKNNREKMRVWRRNYQREKYGYKTFRIK